ncbi:glycosyltransferase family 2 protein [Karstenula rhodostoma CBS 690.94]|uniref:Glycosyltransferase family 2 protein n=1 Tax=Karstenula rhodostoma CBS 690.94 TaxID=1392251 RepID=A0A9P4PF02_9PLEO|nr:glycosyltransferase family 2 protein [Karstenula rhodostoma CBS 690.94]
MASTSRNSVNGWTVILATVLFWGMFSWIVFLISDYRKRTKNPSLVASILLFGHLWLAGLFLATAKIAENHDDPSLVWFCFQCVFRYYKTLILTYFNLRYKPSVAPANFALSPADVTVIVPTVGADGNATFQEMVSSILWNKPKHLIFSTVTEDAKKSVDAILPGIKAELERGTSSYQSQRSLPKLTISTDISVVSAHVASKREQFIRGVNQVDTSIIASADDTVLWHPNFLSGALPAFADSQVSLVGTRKWVKRLPCAPSDPSLPWYTNAWNDYCFRFWNLIGAMYLIRHNFEACGSNTADGGIFAVSGRTLFVRSEVVQEKAFQDNFLNEIIFPWLPGGGIGPINADDDNFLTRWVYKKNKKVKFQASEGATITTVIGKDGGGRFMNQCLRWSRTTMRQNPQVLFIDRTAWWMHPITVWTTYFPWLYNAALVWDPLMVSTMYFTKYYQASEHRFALMAGLVGFIWATKLIKSAPWFWKHPQDFFLFVFPIPVWALFVYGHSILKIHTAFTFWDLAWTGRKLPTNTDAKKEE